MSRAMKILVSAALAAMSLFALSAVTASAHEVRDPITDPTRVAACAFSGLAGTTTPNNPNDTGVEAVEDDILEGDEGSPDPELFPGVPAGTPADILLDTDTGGYTFDGPATCVDTSEPTNPNPVHIHSEGTYRNTICGTGTARGNGTTGGPTDGQTATTIKNPAGTVTYFDTVHYKIVFVGGEGDLTIWHATDQANPRLGSKVTGEGFVHIHPTPDDPTTPANESGGNCATTDVTSFSVAGAFTVVE